jgi:hypothetical protein
MTNVARVHQEVGFNTYLDKLPHNVCTRLNLHLNTRVQ